MFDKAAVFQVVNQALSPAERRRTEAKEFALSVCMDEMGQRLRSASFIRSYTTSLAADTRETTLTGDNYDLRSLFALKLGTGDNARVLEYTSPQQFLRDFDDPEQDAGLPYRFTVIKSSDGYPTVKFECPMLSTETLTVYYHVELTPDNMAMSRSISAAAAGTLAWFFGIATESGQIYHAQFLQLIRLGREADTFTPNAPTEFRLSKQDRNLRGVQAGIRGKRK